MIFQDFVYLCPTNIKEAVSLLSEPAKRCCPIAGGTNLINNLRSESVKADILVDITRIAELKSIQVTSDFIRIGAALTFNEIIESPLIQAKAPLLVKTSRAVGSDQIRNLGTVGGNVANAAICADSLPSLVCLQAWAVLQTPSGEVRMPVSELVTGPNKNGIPHGGLIQSFEVGLMPPGSNIAFQRIGRRNSMSIARLSLAGLGSLGPDGKINHIRLVPGASFPYFCQSKGVEDLLLGEKPTQKLFIAAGEAMTQQFIQISGERWSAEWKTQVIPAVTVRALGQIFGEFHEN